MAKVVERITEELARTKRAYATAKHIVDGIRTGREERREQELLAEAARQREAYLDLLLRCLVGLIYRDPPLRDEKAKGFDEETREYGWDWPSSAHSMIGTRRMRNVRDLVESVIGNGIPGDLIETGVWRGGACIFMRGVLKAYGVRDRTVWLADSFAGLPPPNEEKYPQDKGDAFHTYAELAVTLEQVRENFARYDLLDDQVRFLKGWFKDTLPTAPIAKLALLRLDGDMYESTIDALTALYPKLSPGGFVIVDDYRVVPGCMKAVDDFRASRGIGDALVEIDGVGVYWQRSA